MKVGTDGVLLGAWLDIKGAAKGLDIGTGTGLLSLMLAQRNPGLRMDAIDVDASACDQARINFAESSFGGRIEVYHQSFHEFMENVRRCYDVLICNPPFYVDGLQPKCTKRSLARHSGALTLDELFWGAKRLLKPVGVLGLVYPFQYYESVLEQAAECKLYPQKVLFLKPTPQKAVHRVFIKLVLDRQHNPVEEELVVLEENGRHDYSERFKELTSPFYLSL
jgi:tRNA1Val (adenine37-N6)-methyltransferase